MTTSDELDIDTYTRIDYAIHLLESGRRLTKHEQQDIALLLRRWRKQRYGSALTHTEKLEGRAEVNP